MKKNSNENKIWLIERKLILYIESLDNGSDWRRQSLSERLWRIVVGSFK